MVRCSAVYIGYDSPYPCAYEACKRSVQDKSNIPVVQLNQSILRESGVYWRDTESLESTEFTYTRFLVPSLCDFDGYAIFCDGDFLFVDSVDDLMGGIDPSKAVSVVKHDYEPLTTSKMNDKTQTSYPRKNWSSMIVWNCGHELNRVLTPEYVNTSPGSVLHRFQWLPDSVIGTVDKEWNWLVGYYSEPSDGKPKALHFTDGGPWLTQYRDCEYSDQWLKYTYDLKKTGDINT